MAEPITRVSLFVPAPRASLADWNAGLQSAGLEIADGTLRGDAVQAKVTVDWIENDGGFGDAFSFGTVEDELVAGIDAAPSALVLHWQLDLREGRLEIAGVIDRLRAASALAVRLEQSKLGWEISHWVEALSSHNPRDWYRATVTSLEDEQALQSCGMHAFSLPDVRIAAQGDVVAVRELASTLNVYQLAEDPVLLTGQTFTPSAETPRRVLERWPDTSYEPTHACHNPYGVWRLGAPNGNGRPQGKLAPVFMPSLYVLLRALESKTGRPLTQKEVEQARDLGACIAMEHRDAQRLERTRGYADLEPELIWEQWQLVRASFE